MTAELYSGEFQSETIAAIENIEAAQSAYMKALKDWRGQAANDVRSLKTQGQSIREDLVRLTTVAQDCITLWTSPEMVTAMETATQMAAALRAINEMKQQNLTFCVMGKAAEPKG